MSAMFPTGIGRARRRASRTLAKASRSQRASSHRPRLRLEPLEDRRLLSGVTMLTHGHWSNAAPGGWVDHMAGAIAQAAEAGGADNVAQYTLVVEDGGGGTIVVRPPSRDSGPAAWEEAVVKIDWSDLSVGLFSSTPTGDVADAVADYLIANQVDGRWLLESPLHLIGHSRGASLDTVLAKRLGQLGIWVDHFTSLDPHPVDGIGGDDLMDFDDAPMNLWQNVRFADTYWREDADVFDFDGEEVDGAYNLLLDEGVLGDGAAANPGYSYEHSDVHLWYHGTIDTTGDLDDGDVGEPVPEDAGWYDGDMGPRDAVGFHYGRIRGGVRPASGQASQGAHREPLSLTVDGPDVWDNVEIPDLLDDHSLVPGQDVELLVGFEDLNRDATVTLGYDTDADPYNGLLAVNQQSQSTAAYDDQIPFTLATADMPLGNYRVCAGISNAAHTRYYYPPGQITLVAGGSLSGTVFRDMDGDGIRDAGEPGLEGWTVQLQPFSEAPLTTFRNPTPAPGDRFGNCVAAMGDNVLVAGGRDDTGAENSGAAYLFDGATGDLLQDFLNPTPAVDDQFGVSLAAVGNEVLVGACRDDTEAEDAGAAYLFDGATGNLLRTLLSPTPASGDYFGRSVAALGDNVLIGAPGADAVYLFSGSTGELVQTFLHPAPGPGFFGVSVAAVGSDVLVGASNAEAAYLFDGLTHELRRTFAPSPPGFLDGFGYCVAARGSDVLVGAPFDMLDGKAEMTVYLFDGSSGELLQQFRSPNLMPHSGDAFGISLAALGNDVLIGAHGEDVWSLENAGAAYLFHGSTGNLLRMFQGFPPAVGEGVGCAVAAVGDKVLIGAAGNDTGAEDAGAAYLYAPTALPSTVTDLSGNYSFTGIKPGYYMIRQIVQQGYVQTLPRGDGTYTVAIVGEENLSGFDFGNFVPVTEPSTVVGRHVFYNHSAWDGSDDTAGEDDDLAVAADKSALMPGGTATFANYTGYSRGINGIMVDIARPTGTPTAADFEFNVGNDDHPAGWNKAPDPAGVSVRPGQGTGGSDRVTVIWGDNVIQKQWLQVTVLPGGNTGLAEADVFYFGNAVGESGNSTGDAKVNAYDMLGARDNQRTFLNPAPVDFAYDYNRDQRVNAYDMLLARDNQTHFLNALKLISVPAKESGPQELPGREIPSETLAWLHEFEQIDARRRPCRPLFLAPPDW